MEKMTTNSDTLKRGVATSGSFFFLLVSARVFSHTDVGYINISLIVVLNAKTQYRARQLQHLKLLASRLSSNAANNLRIRI